jgi:hypothetical protein
MTPRLGRLSALVALAALAACSNPRSESSRALSARIDAENAVLIAARTPKSVIYRNEMVRLRPGGAVVCGEFDGLNARQAWAGFTRFIYAHGAVLFDDGQRDFAARWRDACAAS